jgi:hypothetical protein
MHTGEMCCSIRRGRCVLTDLDYSAHVVGLVTRVRQGCVSLVCWHLGGPRQQVRIAADECDGHTQFMRGIGDKTLLLLIALSRAVGMLLKVAASSAI